MLVALEQFLKTVSDFKKELMFQGKRGDFLMLQTQHNERLFKDLVRVLAERFGVPVLNPEGHQVRMSYSKVPLHSVEC